LAMQVPVQASAPDSLKFGLQGAIAPFVLPNRDSGLLIDVLREALATQGVGAEFSYVPVARSDEAMRAGMIDVATSVKPGSGAQGVMTHWPILHFRNQAITLKVRIPRMHTVEELARYRVTAFNGASQVLGQAYRDAVGDNPSYKETQNMPSALLMLGQVDVIISQPDIFRFYLMRQPKYGRSDDSEVAYHDILGKANEYWFAFQNTEQRDLFERGLATLYRTGAIDKIFERYQKQYGTSRELFKPLDCQFLTQGRPRGC
jgi:polar amino acid transport system substrate-binding protein